MRSVKTAQGVLEVHPSSEDGLIFSIIGPLDSSTTSSLATRDERA